MGCLYPGRIMLGVGTGEALNEIATGWRGEWPEFKERFARLRESVDLMRAALDRGPGQLRRRVLLDRRRDDLRPTRHPDPGLRRRRRPGRRALRGSRRRRLHLHLGQGHEPLHRGADPGREGGRRAGRPQLRRHRPHDRDQAVATTPTPTRRSRTPASGRRWRCRKSRSTTSPTRSRWRRRRMRCRSSRSPRAGSSAATPTRSSRASSSTSTPGMNHLVFHSPGHDQRRFLELFERDLAPRLRALG